MVLLSRLVRLLLPGLLLCLGGSTRVAAQMSPGPLARAHRELEGSLKCTRCHGGRDGMQTKCLACHRDIGWLAALGRGVHGSAAARTAKCASCHPDHAGEAFALIKWPDGSADKFDHRRAGWPLEQSHAKVKCADCHQPAYRAGPAAPLAAGGRSSWTGLEPGCAGCHEDVHRGALGAGCTACHDAGTWARTPGFAHDTTAYPLTGRHREVGCDKCHLAARLPLTRDPAGRAVPLYKPLPHGVCTACHRDVHNGGFGPDCAACHTTKGFQEISGTRFAHERTAFPLRGKHAGIPCASCHRDLTSAAGRKPPFATCAACHSPDPHGGTATLQGKPADCAACHSERGFSRSTFAPAQHQTARYPLEGRHAAVTCSACHARDQSAGAAARLGSSRVILRPGFSTCAGCHPDDHGGQLAARPRKGECAECHSPAGWKPSRFGAREHATLELPLEGRHAAIACGSCHRVERAGLGRAGIAFGGIASRCAACHTDPHAGRFEPSGPRPQKAGCVACHALTSFRPASVDAAIHAGFSFPLRGAHRATPCGLCHKELVRFQADTTCAGCHATVHGTQFDGRKGGNSCAACHGEERFAPASRFDHDRDASFPLGKGHREVACAACHRTTVLGGVRQVYYRPLSSTCESCHIKRPG